MANAYESKLASGGGTAPTGDATVADVLATKTFSNADSVGLVGTMTNNGAVSGVATPSQPYTIPAGYHNGSGTVTASGVSSVLAASGDYIYTNSLSTSLALDIGTSSGTITNTNGYNATIINTANITSVAQSQAGNLFGYASDLSDTPTEVPMTANTPVNTTNYAFVCVFNTGAGTITIS